MPGFILSENVLSDATIIADDSISGFPGSNCVDGLTSTKTAFTGGIFDTNHIEFDCGEDKEVDCFVVQGHNGTDLSTSDFRLYASDNGVIWTQVSNTIRLEDNKYIGYDTFSAVTHRYYRIWCVITGTLYFSNISVGKKLDLERSQKHGFIKPDFVDSDSVTANITRGQNFNGFTVKRLPKRARFDLFYYSDTFFSDWPNIVAAMKQRPIYFLWDDNEKVFYCWPTKKMPQPSYAKNINNYYNVKLDMSGFIE